MNRSEHKTLASLISEPYRSKPSQVDRSEHKMLASLISEPLASRICVRWKLARPQPWRA
jgi:hypothetical protein